MLKLPQPIVYINSICNGIILVCDSGAEAYSGLIQPLHHQIKIIMKSSLSPKIKHDI